MRKTGTSDSLKDWFVVREYNKLPDKVGRNGATLPANVSSEMCKLLADYNTSPFKTFEDIVSFHVAFECPSLPKRNSRVGRLILFKERLKHNIVPFIIEDNLQLDYRDLKERDYEKGYLMYTALLPKIDSKFIWII